MDILILAKKEVLQHKLDEKYNDTFYWTLASLPKDDSVLEGKILFAENERVYAEADIIGRDYIDKAIVFGPLREVDYEQPCKGHYRGFTYVKTKK